MYGMDVNPLTHKLHLADLEREAVELRQPKRGAVPESAHKRRLTGASLMRRIPFLFVAWRAVRSA